MTWTQHVNNIISSKVCFLVCLAIFGEVVFETVSFNIVKIKKKKINPRKPSRG